MDKKVGLKVKFNVKLGDDINLKAQYAISRSLYQLCVAVQQWNGCIHPLSPAYWVDTLAYMPYVPSFLSVLFSSVQSPRLGVPLCSYKPRHPRMGPLAKHTIPLLSPLFYTSIIKSSDPKKLVTLVEVTPRGFHTKAAKAAEGVKAEIMVQTFSKWDFLLVGLQYTGDKHKKSAKNNELLLLLLLVSIPIFSINWTELYLGKLSKNPSVAQFCDVFWWCSVFRLLVSHLHSWLPTAAL